MQAPCVVYNVKMLMFLYERARLSSNMCMCLKVEFQIEKLRCFNCTVESEQCP